MALRYYTPGACSSAAHILVKEASASHGIIQTLGASRRESQTLEAPIGRFVEHFSHARYHESLENLTPADVYFGRGQTILLQRERIQTRH